VQWIRDTWLPDTVGKIDTRFFYGGEQQRELLPDEVQLDCGDGYIDVFDKVQGMWQWTLDHGYDQAAKVDDDTYIHVDKFLSLVKPYTYAGNIIGHKLRADDPSNDPPYANGFCYWVDRRFMSLVKNTVRPPGEQGNREDYCMGFIARDAGIVPEQIGYRTFLDCLCPHCVPFMHDAAVVQADLPKWRDYFLARV
jgi:hypothetical protein